MKTTVKTTDNSRKKIGQNHVADLSEIASHSIKTLREKNRNLLILPNNLKVIDKQSIFSLSDDTLITHNIMGFVGAGNTRLTITSRFAKEDKHDYFLHYMLQKVMSINIFDFDHNASDEDSFYDFLLYFFPSYLGKALNQGVYKEYHRNEYNDANVRGAIDIKRHIKLNIPFVGKVAYTMREYVYDNPITQLVRHTIEYIKTHPFGKRVLNGNSDIVENVNQIIFHTPNYNKNDRQKIINFNIKKKVNHPYFSAYKGLQDICIRILQKDKITFGEQDDKIYGLLFDGAWLWEEYLNKVFMERKLGFTHADNINQKRGIPLFYDSDLYLCYPDFYKKGFVLDAKYKHLDKRDISADDRHQIISYMHVDIAALGGFIYPATDKSNTLDDIGTLNGYGGDVKIWGLAIPQESTNWDDFTNNIQKNEKNLCENWDDFTKNIQENEKKLCTNEDFKVGGR